MSKTWRCGDCGTEYPNTVHHCTRYFDDYVSLRGGSVESAISQAVGKAIAPLVREAEMRIQRSKYRYFLGATRMVPVATIRNGIITATGSRRQVPITAALIETASEAFGGITSAKWEDASDWEKEEVRDGMRRALEAALKTTTTPEGDTTINS